MDGHEVRTRPGFSGTTCDLPTPDRESRWNETSPWRRDSDAVLSACLNRRTFGPVPLSLPMPIAFLLAEIPAAPSPSTEAMSSTAIAWLICPIVGHVLGAIPVGLLLGRAVRGIDLREHGSGNIGATNAARVLGWKWGTVALILDALKGVLPVLLARQWTRGSPDSLHLQVVTGVVAILGHMFPLWLKFRGGKGVATGLGVALVLSPVSALLALGAYVFAFAATRVSSIGSLAGAVTFPAVEWIRSGSRMFSSEHWSLAAFSLAIPALIIVRHRSNISRLLRGQEKALAPSSKPPEPPADKAD